MEFVNTTIWNVIAELPADTSSPVSNEIVLVGNHRDAWVFGAADPNSGTSVMLEAARSVGELVKQGYKPKRKIMFCSWDGEEYGLLGSTAFVERHNTTLTSHAVAYLNIDTAVTGTDFSAAATPSLIDLIHNVTQEVPYPGSSSSLRNNWSGFVGVLGSGSDYTAFLHHYGIPAVSLEFNGPYGVYHSVYDSMHWMETFGDPTFDFYVTLTQTFGLLALRLADYKIIAFDFVKYGDALSTYQLEAEYDAQQANMNLDFSELTTAIASFATSASVVNGQIRKFKFSFLIFFCIYFFFKGDAISSGDYNKQLNDRLLYTERYFIGLGLPHRPYYKHG